MVKGLSTLLNCTIAKLTCWDRLSSVSLQIQDPVVLLQQAVGHSRENASKIWTLGDPGKRTCFCRNAWKIRTCLKSKYICCFICPDTPPLIVYFVFTRIHETSHTLTFASDQLIFTYPNSVNNAKLVHHKDYKLYPRLRPGKRFCACKH